MTARFTPTLDFDGEYEVSFTNARTGFAYRVPWSAIAWKRKRADVSEAQITTIPLDGPAWLSATETLRALEPWTCELNIFRDGVKVWTGPVTGFSRDEFSPDKAAAVTLRARDRSAVLKRRLVAQSRTFTSVDLGSGMLSQLLADVYAVAGTRYAADLDIGTWGVSGSRVFTVTSAEYMFDVLQEIAERGIAWTMVGDTLVANKATFQAVSDRCGIFTDRAFASLPSVDVEGVEQANYFWTNGNGVTGSYSLVDSAIGLLQRAEQRDEITNVTDANAFAQEQYNRFRFPSLSIGVATLSRRSPIAFDDLVPGANVSLSFEESAMLGVADVLGVVRFGIDEVAVEVNMGSNGLSERVRLTLGYKTEGVS